MKRGSGHIATNLLCLVAIVLVLAGAHFGQAVAQMTNPVSGTPRTVPVKAFLFDSSGQSLPDGRYNFTFALYTSPTDGSPIWVEEHTNVEVTDGHMLVYLGRGTVPVPLDLPSDRQYFLGVRLDDDPEMVPRRELKTSAYSFRARTADEVSDASIAAEEFTSLSATDEGIESVSGDEPTGGWDDVSSGSGKGGSGPVPSAVWHTKGNIKTDPEEDYIGTGDSTDLCFRTDDQERMRIMSYGKIVMKSALLVEDYITSRKTPNEGGFLLADPDHGLKRVGNDDVRLFTTGGNLLLEGGNVGIGISAPSAALHVNTDAATAPFSISEAGNPKFTVDQDGRVQILSSVTGPQNNKTSYPLYIDAPTHGIAIQVDGAVAHAGNNYVAFFDDNSMVGRIEGMNAVDQLTDPEYIMMTALDAFELTMALIDEGAALASENVCVGVGAVGCPPIVSLIAGAALKIAECAVRTAAVQIYTFSNLGVSYQSGAGDYAEWLERLDEAEKIEAGDIVGVFGGKITRSTEGAQQILSVSASPIVLGNMPAEGQEHLYEKVAFLGQVPVKVIGMVRQGDYIIPSGLEDGTGIAVSPELMTADEYAKAVGRAWSASDNELVKPITVAVGLNQADIATLVKKQQAEVSALKAELASWNRESLQAQAGLDELRNRVAALDGLYQEVRQLRAAVGQLQEAAPARMQEAQAGPATQGSLVSAEQ